MTNAALINITYSDDGIPAVNGRELHGFLEVKTLYKDWFPRMCEYGFTDNVDYIAVAQKRATAQGNETTYTDHVISLDMAKEISMLQRNEKGKQARQYFIQVEKQYNNPEMVMARALKLADKKILEATNKIQALEAANMEQAEQLAEQAPKVAFANAYSASNGCMLIRDYAKYLRQKGVDIGEKRLFEWLRSNGYLTYRNNFPTQKAMDLQLFNVQAGSYTNSKGEIVNTHTSKLTPKGQVYFLRKMGVING